MLTCKDCLYYDVCGYKITEVTHLTVDDCRHSFKNKANFIEIIDNPIIYTQGKWLVLNMESEDLGKAIKLCMDFLTKGR